MVVAAPEQVRKQTASVFSKKTDKPLKPASEQEFDVHAIIFPFDVNRN